MTPKPSERVRKALDVGWSPACDGLVAASWFGWEPREGRGTYRNLTIRAGEREAQVSISPTGRSVQVYVDGNQV